MYPSFTHTQNRNTLGLFPDRLHFVIYYIALLLLYNITFNSLVVKSEGYLFIIPLTAETSETYAYVSFIKFLAVLTD